MENTNNEIKELKFTQEDIFKALLKLDEETRAYIMNYDLEKIVIIANDVNTQNSLCNTCDANIIGYQKMKESIKAFASTLEEQKEKGVEHTIDEMIDNYKGFSREDKLEFNKKLFEANNLESSLDNFGYALHKLVDKLSGVK